MTRAWPHSSRLPPPTLYVHGSASGTQSGLGGGSGGGNWRAFPSVLLGKLSKDLGFGNSLWFPGRTRRTLGSPDFCNHWPEGKLYCAISKYLLSAAGYPVLAAGQAPCQYEFHLAEFFISASYCWEESLGDTDEKTNGLAGEWGLAQSKRKRGISGCRTCTRGVRPRSASLGRAGGGTAHLKASGRKERWRGIQTSRRVRKKRIRNPTGRREQNRKKSHYCDCYFIVLITKTPMKARDSKQLCVIILIEILTCHPSFSVNAKKQIKVKKH